MNSNDEENGVTNDKEMDETGDAGQEQLDTIENQLQVKIKKAVGRQVGRLIEVADQVEDPTDALALLYQGSDVFHSMKMQRMSKIDDTLPQPAEITTYGVVGIPIPEEDLTPAAFSNMDTADLYKALVNMRQQAVGKWVDLTKPTLPPDNPEAKATLGDILDLIEQVGLAHYEIVRVGLYLHILLSQLYHKFGALPFLTSKGQVEQLLLRYNAHNPHLGIGIEEQELHGVQTILAVVNRVYSYLMSAEFFTYREQKSAAAGGGGKSGQSSGFSGVYSARVNLVRHMPGQLKPEKDALEARGEKGKRVLQTSAQIVPVIPVAVDLGETRDPKDALTDIAGIIQGLVEKGMDFIYQLKKIARPINFNIYTLQFGEATPLQDNRTMMQKMRKDIYQYIIKDIKLSATMRPKIFLKNTFLTQAFAGRYGAGPAVDAVSLDPGEEREITHETTVTTKRMTEESDSIFDGKTSSVKDSLERSRQNQLSKTNTDTAELTSYVDSSVESKRDTSLEVGVEVGVDLGYVSGGVDVNYKDSSSVTQGVQAGSNSTVNSAREEAVTNTEGMMQNHTEEVSANRERTTTKTSKQEEELSQKDKEVRKVKNPNRSSPLTIIFSKLVQAYNTVITTPGFRIMFMNGSVIEECSVSMMQRAILDKYIKPEARETRQKIWELVKASAQIVDHQGRLINLLDETGGTIRLRGDEFYFNLLKRQGIQEKAEDLPLQFYKKQLKGVVLSTRQYTLPQCGLLRRAIIGESALDANEQLLFDIEAEKLKNEAALVQNQVENGRAFREFFRTLPDNELRLKAGFLLMTPPAEVLQKGTLNYIAGLNGTDPQNLNKMKSYLQSLKLDV